MGRDNCVPTTLLHTVFVGERSGRGEFAGISSPPLITSLSQPSLSPSLSLSLLVLFFCLIICVSFETGMVLLVVMVFCTNLETPGMWRVLRPGVGVLLNLKSSIKRRNCSLRGHCWSTTTTARRTWSAGLAGVFRWRWHSRRHPVHR